MAEKVIGLIGAGTMSTGIAQSIAQAGYKVQVYIRRAEPRDAFKPDIAKRLKKAVEKNLMTQDQMDAALNNIVTAATVDEMVKGKWLILEVTSEDMAIKKAILEELSAKADPATILATNTSALSITELAMYTNRPDKFIGIHFFNPAHIMKLVEIIYGQATDENIAKEIFEFVAAIGKTPVRINEAPGFVVNRVLIPMINEACFCLMEGVASRDDIDNAMKLGAGHPMGPLALGDLIGLDVCLAIMETLYNEFGDPKYRPCPLLRKMVRAGKLGKKTNTGFYNY
jgi:3-hydroxybutyryl-CoA dehydrogenase